MRLTDVFAKLTIKQLLERTAGEIVVPRPIRKTKAALTAFITEHLTPTLEKNLRNPSAECTAAQTSPPVRKRKREDHPSSTRKASRLDPNDPEDSGEFLELPSESVRKSCYREFYMATSNTALELVVCAICAREQGRQADNVTTIALDEIRSPSRLTPGQPHPQHTLFDGMLLQPEGVAQQGEHSIANVCGECSRDLQKEMHFPPKFHQQNRSRLWRWA